MVKSCVSSESIKFSETNILFQLFQTNVLVFSLSSILLALKQYFGSPIDCIYDGIQEKHKSFVDNYCWKNYEPIVPQISSVPLVSKSPDLLAFSSNLFQRKQSSYYRWFALVLLFQALLAYIPSWSWNVLRDRRLHETISSIKDPLKQHNRKKLIIINLANDLFTEKIQKRYAKPFFFCEFLNLVLFGFNVICTNLLFQNHFVMYGFNEIGMRFSKSLDINNNHDYSEIFPVFAKCSVQIGRNKNIIIKEDAVCMLSFNQLCESIFLFQWVWFLVLIVAAIFGLSYRAIMILSRRNRIKLLMECVDKTFEEKLTRICEKLGFYSWFTLYRISRNVDPLTFQDIISSLMARLDSLPLYTTTVKTTSRKSAQHETAFAQPQNLATVSVV